MPRPSPHLGCALACALRFRVGFIAAICLALSFLAPTVRAEKGRWTPVQDWSGGDDGRYAIHLLLLPENGNPERSRILWFAGYNPCCPPLRGGEWRWGQGNDDCSGVPGTGWTLLPTPPVPGTPGMNLFCTSHAPFGDGRMVFAGGDNHDTHSYGENQTRVFVTGSEEAGGTWGSPNPGLMSDWRWYPTATTLRDGRVLVTGGDRYPHHRLFGGKRGTVTPPATPSWGDTLSRFAPVENGYWDKRVLPRADLVTNLRPDPRYGHSGVEMAKVPDFQGQTYFGGIGSDGQPLDDAWLMTREDNTLGADYIYQWKDLVPNGTRPAKRSSHSAVAALGSQMVVYGGLNADGTPRSDVWRLYKSGSSYLWQQIIAGGAAPGARCGHAAVYDETVIAGGGGTRKRMIVFGGVSAPGQTPTDDKVWELRWDNPILFPNQATWYEMTLANPSGPKPSARYWHTLTQDPGLIKTPQNPDGKYTHSSGKKANIAWLYGGALGSNGYSEELWELWILDDGTVDWKQVTIGPSGSPPGPRARHSVVLDPNFGLSTRLYVYGGEKASGAADPFVYKLDPWAPCYQQSCAPGQGCGHASCGPVWAQWDDYEHTLIGHTMLLEMSTNSGDPLEVAAGLARVAETLSPSPPLAYQTHVNANLYSHYSYPINFVVPGGLGSGCRVVSVGRGSESTYSLDIPDDGSASGWTLRSNQGTGFEAEGGVMYKPGQVMIAGGTLGGSPTGLTKTANLTTNTAWQSSQSMQPRKNHNLVALPNGTVLAVGGEVDGTVQVRRPQIWDPAGNGGVGTWTPMSGADALVEQALRRGYHSTAILLPDGRVLSAGGEYEDPNGDKWKAEIFCPAYLFKADGNPVQQRPVIGECPRSIAWGDTFTICTANPSLIQKVSMMRPGATTHAFDQNQRCLPLDILERRSFPAQLLVRAPASPDSAPPGNYLLFILGSQDGADVPSIAKWVSIGCPTCDATLPAANNDLFIEIVSDVSVYPMWVAKGDDGILGTAARYDFRRSTQPITDANFADATKVGLPPPLCPGWTEFQEIGGLTPCTTYYFAFKTRDGARNWSAMSNVLQEATIGTGCGGGGFSAVAAGSNEGGVASATGADVLSSSAESPAYTLVAETSRLQGAWRVNLRQATAADGIDAVSGIVVDRQDDAGGRDTLGQISLEGNEALLGICSLRDRGRVALPGVRRLEHVTSHLKHGSDHLALTDARHSRLGSMGADFIANGGTVELLAGDIVELTYILTADPPPPSSWYALVRRQGTGTPIPFSQRPRVGDLLPEQFALHQNEPNPAGSSTLVRFDVPRESEVRLEVFDLLGRRIAVLAQGRYQAGSHSATWSLQGMSGGRARPGVYMCQMIAGNFRARRAMVLLQ